MLSQVFFLFFRVNQPTQPNYLEIFEDERFLLILSKKLMMHKFDLAYSILFIPKLKADLLKDFAEINSANQKTLKHVQNERVTSVLILAKYLTSNQEKKLNWLLKLNLIQPSQVNLIRLTKTSSCVFGIGRAYGMCDQFFDIFMKENKTFL